MVRKAGNITELVLNAEFLLGEWVMALLRSCPDIYATSCYVGLTAEQRCRLVIWYTKVREDPDDLGQTFTFLLSVCQARSNLVRLTEQKLLGDLGAAYVRTCRPDADEDDVLCPDPFSIVRYAGAGHLSYAHAFLSQVAVEDTGEE
jgi:hypothetical protein